MKRLAKFSLLLLAVTVGSYGVGTLDGHDRPLEHMEKPWVVRAMGL